MIDYEELRNLLEGKVYGPIYSEIKITGFSDIRYAKENEIALMFRLEEKKYIDNTRAKIIVCNPFFTLSYKKSFIFSIFKLYKFSNLSEIGLLLIALNFDTSLYVKFVSAIHS